MLSGTSRSLQQEIMGRFIKVAAFIVLGSVVLGGLKGNGTGASGHAAGGSSSRTPGAPLISFTPSDLALAYSANSVAADETFKGQRYRVSGTIDSINSNLWGTPYITMKGGVNMFSEPQFSFADTEKSHVAKLQKGSLTTLICIGSGDVVKAPMSNDCVFD